MRQPFIALSFFVVAAGIASAIYFLLRPAPQPFLLGFLTTATGRYTSHGEECRAGLRLAIEEINEAGGIAGRPVVTFEIEDEANPQKAIDAIHTFQSKGIEYVVGPFLSSVAQKLAPLATQKGMLLMGPVVATQTLAGIDDSFFRLFPSIFVVGENLGTVIVKDGARKIGFVYDLNNKEYGESFLAGIRKSIEKNQNMAMVVHAINPSEKNFSFINLANSLADYDALVFSFNPADTAILAQRVREKSKTSRFYASSWSMARDLFENGSHAIVGLKGFMPFNETSQNPEYLRFKKRFLERFKITPSYCSAYFHDATHILLKTIASIPSPTPQKVKAALVNKHFASLQGDIAFDANGDVNRPLYLYEATEQKLELISEVLPTP